MNKPFSIFPLGDSAITLDLGYLIDEELNRKVLAMEEWLRAHTFQGLRDIIVAYSSITIFYDPVAMISRVPAYPGGIYNYVKDLLEEAWTVACISDKGIPARETIRIAVCYGGMYGPDLEELGKVNKISREDIIALHCSLIYRVYMIGFLPGFPYLGKVDARLETGRKSRPAPVAAGGVGIAGNQTGIYPVNSPGGWQIIGRTPVKLFDPAATPPVTLVVGDQVQFYPIGPEEFRASCPG